MTIIISNLIWCGLEAVEEIKIIIGIEDFRCRFATLVGKTGNEIFEVPVSGDMVTNEFHGTIDVPEFYATVEGPLTDDLYISRSNSGNARALC